MVHGTDGTDHPFRDKLQNTDGAHLTLRNSSFTAQMAQITLPDARKLHGTSAQIPSRWHPRRKLHATVGTHHLSKHKLGSKDGKSFAAQIAHHPPRRKVHGTNSRDHASKRKLPIGAICVPWSLRLEERSAPSVLQRLRHLCARQSLCLKG